MTNNEAHLSMAERIIDFNRGLTYCRRDLQY